MDKIPIGSLKSTLHGIQSCKLVCYSTPFCKSYEYLMYDDSCNFYSNSKIDNFYKNLIEKLKKSSSSSSSTSTSNNLSFNLMHLLQADFFNLVEEHALTKVTILDRKAYAGCEPKPSDNVLEDEMNCSDQLADYMPTYTLDNLVPATDYQFRVEIASPFGLSKTYYSESIQVPFSLNPIVEKSQGDNYSLECSTSILDTRRLTFQWFRNGSAISFNNSSSQSNDYETRLNMPDEQSDGRLFSSVLLFKAPSAKLNGVYTCSLAYSNGRDIYLNRNVSFLFQRDIQLTYSEYNDSTVTKLVGQIWTDSCAAQGWPLPVLTWQLNGSPVTTKTNTSLSLPYMITHHRNLTVTSYVVAQNLNADTAGRYTCVLNSNLKIKNVTLLVNKASQDESTTIGKLSATIFILCDYF
jgi:hypothetical protein